MALNGVHFACGFGGGTGKRGLTLPITTKPVWSETMASAGTTANAAPSGSQEDGDAVIEVRASIDVFVAFGPTPNATSGARVFVAAADFRHFSVSPGDKAAWVAA